MNFRRLVAAVLPFVVACANSIDFWAAKEFDINIAQLPPQAAAVFVDGAAKENQMPVDLSNQKEVMEKLQNIDSVVVPEIWLEVSNLDATNQVTSASGYIDASEDVDGAERIRLGDFTDLPVAEGGKITLTLNADNQKRVEQLALEKKKFKIYYSASLNRDCASNDQCASSKVCTEGRCSTMADALPAKFHVKANVHVLVTVKL